MQGQESFMKKPDLKPNITEWITLKIKEKGRHINYMPVILSCRQYYSLHYYRYDYLNRNLHLFQN